jgi:uncharacterized membrane protein
MAQDHDFPFVAALLLGMGLGGFVDGILLHQILQWHHIASAAGHPLDEISALRFNVTLDGAFHVLTWGLVVTGLALLWRTGWQPGQGRAFAGTCLMGFGLFNLVEGTINHHLLGLHHVNETVPESQWIWWDLGFLASGALLLAVGVWLSRPRHRA